MNNILLHYQANKRIWQAGFAFILCIVIHNFPWLIDFLPDDARQAIQTTVSVVINGGVGFLALFLTKQFNTSGIGTLEKPFKKPTADGGTRIVE